MKIKRLFAAILTALMVVSCFSFTASAQETQTVTNPVATVQTAKANHATYRAESALTKTKLYDAVSDKIYYRFTPVASAGSATTKLDAYGLPVVKVTNGVCYMAIDLRSNYAVEPWCNVYHVNEDNKDVTVSGSTQGFAVAAAKGDEKWERVVVKIEKENLKDFSQIHFYLFSKTWTTAANTPADAYADVAAFGFFNDEYSAKNYDFGTAIAADGDVSFSVDGEVLDEVPTADPEIADGYFMGWSVDADATKGDVITALSTVPTAATTYYAIFSGEIEDEKAVYISASGDDANSGRHSKAAVKTLAKANELLKGEGINTLYVVGDVDGTGTDIGASEVPGVSEKKIYIQGYSGDGTEVLSYDGHYKYKGDVEYKNITVYDIDAGDGQHLAQGYDITFGENVIIKDKDGTSGRIGQGYYNSFNNINNTVRLNSGTWSRFYYGAVTGSTITGNTEYIIDGTANVKAIYVGHGSGTSTQATKGTTKITINGGTIAIDVGGSQGNMNSLHQGLRYYTLNGGTVSSFYTRSNDTYASYEGITVYEINKGVTITPETIGETSGTTDDSETRVVIFNDGFDAVPVGDAGAIVLDVTGAEVHADVTVASDYTATLNGFTYDLEANYYDTVKIGDNEIKLDTLADGVIPADKFAVGLNTVEFFEAEVAPQTVVYVSASGDDANKGDTAEAPVKTLKRVRELLDANGTIVTVYIIGTVVLTADDATNINPNKKSYAVGAAGRKVTYLGYGENAIFDAQLMPVYLCGEVEMNNFFFQQQTTWDGKFMTEGHDLTIGENMSFGGYDSAPATFTYGGDSSKLTNFYYALKGNFGGDIPTPLINTINVNGGYFASLQPAIYSGSSTFKGEVTVNLANKAKIDDIRLGGQGYDNKINTYGTIIVNVNDGATVKNFVSEVGGNSIGNYSGLREININGGSVGTIKTTAKATSSKGNAEKREQLMVITVNSGTLGAVTKPYDDENEKSTVVLIFNDGIEAVEYVDKDAYILDVTGANIAADTTVSEDYTTATLNKFTYTVTNEKADRVVITAGETTSTYALADLGGEIALDKLAKGTVNEIVFEKTPVPAQTVVYVSATGADTNNGATAETAVATLARAYEIVNDENNAVETIYIVGEVVSYTDKDANWSVGVAGKTLKVVGQNSGETKAKLTFDKAEGQTEAHRVYFYGDVTVENITFDTTKGGEAGYASLTAKSLTIGNGVVLKNKGANTVLTGSDYADPNPSTVDSTIIVNGTDYAPATLIPGAGYAGNTKTGSVTVTVNAGTIPELRLTKGSTGNGSINNEFRGTVKYEINGGKVDKINFGNGGNFKGFGHMVINGGEIDMLYTKSVNHSWASWIEYPIALTNAGVFVFEINGGTINRFVTQTDTSTNVTKYIAKNPGATGYPDTFTNVKRVVIFNDGVTPVTVEDTGITYVLNVTGGKVTADVTLAEDKTNATLNKFKFETTNEEFDQVTIKVGETSNTYKLADLNGEIALDKLTAGTAVHEITFSKYVEAPKTANAIFNANGGAWGEETTKTVVTNIGEVPTAPEAPVYAGYVFKGWTPDLVAMVAEGATYTAAWEKEAPTTATLKFYDGETLFVEKTVAIGATDDVLPVWSDLGRENAAANDTFARPDKDGYYLKGWAAKDSTELLVPGTFAATEDASYYAVWEEADMIVEDEVTITLVSDKANSPIPADAQGFYNTFVDGTRTGPFAVNYNADGTEYTAINSSLAVPGLAKDTEGSTSKTTTSSYYGSSGKATASVIFPEGVESIWYKWNDGKYLGVATPITGEVNVAYVINASPSETTKRGFYLEAGDVAGTLNLATVKEGTADFVVSFKTTLEEGDIIKYAAPADFNNKTIKAAQLLGIYVWADEVEQPEYNEPIFEVVASEDSDIMHATYCTQSEYVMYDNDADIVYSHYTNPTNQWPEANIYGLKSEGKNFGTTKDTLYGVMLVRTNIIGGKACLGLYTVTGGRNGEYYVDEALTAEDADTWQVLRITLTSGAFEDCAQVRVWPADAGEDLSFVPAEGGYFDIAAVAIFEDEYSANNYDVYEAVKATKANATFDANGGAWGEETTKTVETVVGMLPTAPEAPAKAGYTFAGWTPALTAMVAEGATYTANWTIIERTFENAVYLGDAGNDENDGLTPATLVRSLKRVQEIVLANANINTIVVVGKYSKTNETKVDNFLKGANRKITITGQTVESLFSMKASGDSHFRMATDVEFNNLKIEAASGDGGIMSQGYELTFGEGLITSGQKIGFLHYNNQLKDGGVVTVKSGTFGRVDLGVQSGQTYKGTATINVDGGTITSLTNGHGWKGNQSIYGIFNANVNSGNVGYISLSSTADTAVSNYAGLRYFTINGGTVGDIYTTGSSVSKKYDDTEQKASVRAGVTVVEYNGGTIGTIKLGTNKQTGAADPDDATRVVILNNGLTATVEDTGAIVVKTIGGTVKAATNAQATYPASYTSINADWGKAIKLLGFTYELPEDSTANAVKVDDGEAILLSNLEDNLIVINEAGEHTVEFVYEAPAAELITVNWTVDGETVKTDSVEAGTALTAPEAPAKDGYTFVGWAVEGTTEVITDYTFTADTTLVAVFEKNVELIEVKWTVDGEIVKTDSVEAGTALTAPEAPAKEGYTFVGWAVEGTTEVITDYTFTANTTLVAIFEENVIVPAETAEYRTYGVYDSEEGTYTIELKICGAKAHMGSFGFVLPGLVSVTAAEGITLFAEEEAAGVVVSPIFAKGEGFYANTWAIEEGSGYIDATEEEVLIATFVLEAEASFPNKFEEYVVENADTKYYVNGQYLVAPKFDALDITRIPVTYASHTDSEKEIEEPEFGYKTYGTYNPVDGSYTIDVKFIGGKINAAAFGIAFDSEYMTYDPDAENAFALADGIANYLDVALANTADGIAFIFDGSADAENGFVDATDAEVLIATIKATMTEDQRAAYEAAGAPAFELLDISDVESAELYFNGTDYLVALYADNLAVERVVAPYLAHEDAEAEITTADVTVKVTFANKEGATSANLGYIAVNDGEAVVMDAIGNEEATVEYVIEDAKVGETLTINVMKNGYLTATAVTVVSAADNVVELTAIGGDIKGSVDAICGDGEVDLSDFIRVVRAFDENATEDYKNTVDLNEDGAVNVTDLGIVKANFNKSIANAIR